MTVIGADGAARAEEPAENEVDGVGEVDGAPTVRSSSPDRGSGLVAAVVDRVRGWDADTWVLVAGCALAVVFSVWLTWGIWQPGIPAGDDNAAHVARTDFAIDHLFSGGRIDGWHGMFGLGYQEFLFVGPAFNLLAFAIKVLSLGMLSNLDAFKAAVVVSYALLPIAVAFLAWTFGMGRRVAGIAAVLSLAASTPLGGAGVAGVFETGLVTNQLGSVLICFALGGVVLVLRRPTAGRIVFTAVAVALVLVSHILSAIILAFLVTALLVAAAVEWFFLHRRSSGAIKALPRLRGLALAALLAAGLSGLVFVPLVVHGNLRGVSTAFPDIGLSERFPEIWRGEFLLRPYVAPFLLAGILFEFIYAFRYRKLALTLLYAPFIFLTIARLFIRVLPGNIVAMQLTNRSWAYVAFLALLPLAHLLSWSSAWVLERMRPPAVRTALVVCVPLVAAMALVVLPPKLQRDEVHAVTPTPAIVQAAGILQSVVPEGGRFATQRLPGKEVWLTGMTHPDFWLPAVTGKNTLNIWNPESSSVYGPVFEPEHVSTEPAEAEADKLARYGVSHLLVLEAASAPDIASSPRFRKIWGLGDMHIYEVLAPSGRPPAATLVSTDRPASASVAVVDDEFLQFAVQTQEPTLTTFAVAWSPKWQVTVDGAPVPTEMSEERLIAAHLPAGTSTIELRYASDGWDWLGRALTLASIAAVGVWFSRRRGNRGRTTPPSAPEA